MHTYKLWCHTVCFQEAHNLSLETNKQQQQQQQKHTRAENWMAIEMEWISFVLYKKSNVLKSKGNWSKEREQVRKWDKYSGDWREGRKEDSREGNEERKRHL